jgi:hypothetical protein
MFSWILFFFCCVRVRLLSTLESHSPASLTIFIAAHENKSKNSFVSISVYCLVPVKKRKNFSVRSFYQQTKDFGFSCADNYDNFLLLPSAPALGRFGYFLGRITMKITTLMYVVIIVILVPQEGS